MRISTPRLPDLQPALIGGYGQEDRIFPLAACRSYVGDFFEELTVNTFGGQRLKTDSTKDICPDIQIRDTTFLESKSVGCSGAIIVYESRLMKDLAFVAEGNTLYYIFWQHNCRITDGMKLGALRDALAVSVKSVTVVPLEKLRQSLTTLKVLNAKHTARGYGSHGYTSGYQPRLSDVQRNVGPCKTLFPNQLVAYGRRITGSFAVYGDVNL